MLNICQGSLLVIIIAAVQDSASQKPISNKVQLVLHSNKQSWNDAQAICRSISGTLYTEDSYERTLVLRHYMNTDTYRSYDCWLGLHFLAAEAKHGWTNCESVTASSYTVWKNGNWPTDGASKQCVNVHDMANSHWHTKDCSDSKTFICEVRGAECTFTSLGMAKPDITERLQLTEADLDSCKRACLTRIQNDKNCWALTWNSAGSTNNCVLFFDDNPFEVTSSSVTAASDQEVLVKECYGFEESNDNPAASDTSSTPNSGCTSFDTTTTTSTTTTSTTTAPTTTTTTGTSTTSTSTPTTTTTTPTTATTTPTTTTTTPTTTTTTPTTTTSTTTSPTTTKTSPTTSTTISPTTTSTSPTTSTTTSTTPITSTISSTSSIASPTTTSTTTSPSTSSTTTHPTTTTTPQTSNATALCNCSCSNLRQWVSALVLSDSFNNLTLEQKVEVLQFRLKLDKNQLSSTIRKKTSAVDNRTESKAVGSVGITFLCVMFIPIFISDAVKLLAFMHEYSKKAFKSTNGM